MSNGVSRRSWLEIDLGVIKQNYHLYKENIPKDIKIMLVVKADVYGHGDVEVASYLQDEGVCEYVVSNIVETIRLQLILG